MSLSSEQKSFIRKNQHILSVKRISEQLHVDRALIKEYLNSLNDNSIRHKKRIFTVILILIPLLFFIFLELSLRLFNYGGDLDLFISGSSEYTEYKMCNPRVGFRFFYEQKSTPSPPLDLFLKEKPENAFRIFVLGGSTAAGYPYGNNLMFSRILQQRLEETYPEKTIEVVNTAMAAINSYAYIDYIDEIFENQPDAILIYGGHNEYYGVLGVASAQNLGKNRTLKLAYLQLNNIRIFILLRNTMSYFREIFADIGEGESDAKATATMMERLVGEQQILYQSDTYLQGRDQFYKNMKKIFEKGHEKQVTILMSDLVSNIKDQAPFISLTSNQYPEAKQVYEEARNLEKDQQYSLAKEKYYWAKDLDALRFRATEEINKIIYELCDKYQMPVVSMKSAFEAKSSHGLIGNALMLEHLHPTIKGYFLMAAAFYQKIMELELIKKSGDAQSELGINQFTHNARYTELDSVYGALRVEILKGGWPFKDKTAPNKSLENYRASTRAESLAVKIWTSTDYTLERGHVELAEFYEKTGQFRKAHQEYLALIALTPLNVSPYLRAADALLKIQALEEALPFLQRSLKIEQTPFAHKWIGQILLGQNQVSHALTHLEEAYKKLPSDPQLLYNLAGAYTLDRQYYKAKGILDKLLYVSPDFPGAQILNAQVGQILTQMGS